MSKLTGEDLVAANQEARTSAIAHNEALKQQTLGAKAGEIALKGLALAGNMIASWALAKGLELVVKGIDNLIHASENAKEAMNDAVSEYQTAQSEVEDLNSELKTTNDRIDELNAKQNLSFVEKDELNTLQETNKELEVKIGLLEREAALKQKDAATAGVKSVKTSFGEDGISENDINTKITNYNNLSDKHPETFLMDKYDLEDNIAALRIYNELLHDAYNRKDQDDIEAYTDTLGDLKDAMTENLSTLYEQKDSMEDYYNYVSNLNYDDLTTKDKEVIAQYERIISDIDFLNRELSPEKYVNDKISGILKKVDFLDYSKQLESLGNNGSLSVEMLTNKFPDLIAYLNEAGISAQDLYDYIMALSNPDAINYSEAKRQLLQSLGIRDGEIGGVSDQKISDEAESLGLFDEEALEAYLTVKTKYTDDETEKWSVKDWAYYIKQELNKDLSDSVETPISTISTSVQQIKDQLSSAFKELGDAYQNIFTEDGFSIDDVDNDMLSGIKSAFEELEGFDTSNLDEFFDTLTNSASTADQVQQAFNDLATAYFYSTDTLNNLNDATAESIEQQLEEMGVANAHEVVYDALNGKMQALALQKQFATQTGYDLINATSEEAVAFLNEAGASETARGYLLLLIAQEQVFSNQDLNVEQKIQKLQQLAAEYGNTALAASVAAKMEEATKSAATGGSYSFQDAFNEAKTEFEKAATTVNIDFKSIGGGSKSAGSAGKEAGDAYVEAYEKELEKLQTARDRGEITEAEYLSRMKALYEKYFGGISKYQDKYFEEQRKYLEGMESLYNSALSGITKLMGNKIDLYNEEKETVISNLQEEKDAAIDALEAQKKAAEEAYQAQIDAIQEKIDALEKEKKANQKIIDGIQDEIDAIKDAADSRKRELTLMKAQYELERARNQRTILQYDEKSGMHYVKDDSAERDAKEKVDDANREIQIAELEKQIDYYEKLNDAIDDTIEGYEDQIDAIQKLLDESNKYYDNLIEQAEKSYDAQIKSMEKYYDSLIKSMESQKSKWEELADIKEIADAYSAVQQVFGDLGYTVEDVLNGNEQAFEDFKTKYIGLMNDMNSNTTFAEGLSYASGVAQENLGSFLDSTQKAADGLDSLGEKADAVDGIATSMSNASTSASELSNSTDGLGENLSEISDSLNNIPDSEQFSGLVTQFSNLGEAIQSVADALGIGAEDTVGGLVGALQSLSTFSLGDEENGLVAQFNQLAEAATNVATAIGGGDTDASTGGNGSTSKSSNMGTGVNGSEGNGSSNSITGALDGLKAKADEVLGEGAEDSEDGEGVIGQFGKLKTAVDDVTTAIGISEEGSDGVSGQEGDESTLTGAITSLGTTTEETLGESGGEGVIGRFEQFRDVINEANEHVTGISDGLDAIDGKEVECTIKVNIETTGSLPVGFGAWTGTAMNLESGSYNAKYGKGLVDGTAHVEGTAKVTGDWGVHQGGQALLGELGREIIVRNGRFFTVGENGAEMQNLQPGDIVFNHVQTEELLKNGHISSRGKAYANGTVNKPSVLDRLRAQGYEVQKYEWKDMYGNLISPQQMNEAAKAWMSGTYECLTPMNDFKEKIKETVKVIEGANVVNNTMNQQQPINVTMGDIHLHEVQDVDGLSKAIIHQMPGKMLQAIHQK